MLARLVEQRRAIGIYANDHVKITSFSIYQLKLIENVLRLFQPFEEVIKRFSLKYVFIRGNSGCSNYLP